MSSDVLLNTLALMSQVTFKFRCLVRVVSIRPSEVVDFCTPVLNKEEDGTTTTGTAASPQFVYAVKLTLEDPTARLGAWLYAEDGVCV